MNRMPGQVIFKLLETPAGIERHGMQFDADQCSPHRHRRSTCRLCVDACPAGAIARGERVTVDADRCTGCGICAAVCPVGAFEMKAPSNSFLLGLARKAAPAAVAFACSQSAPTSGCIRVPCLGRLDEAILVGLAAQGLREVRLVHGACNSCAMSAGRAVADKKVDDARQVLACFGADAEFRFSTEAPSGLSAPPDQAKGPALSRRALFKRLIAPATERPWWELDPRQPAPETPEPRNGPPPPRVPAKRILLLAAVRRLGEPLPGAMLPALTARFEPTSACTGSQMCAVFCPTGALRKTHKQGFAGLAFQASLCTNCGLCREICFWDAVELTPGHEAGSWVRETVKEWWRLPASGRS